MMKSKKIYTIAVATLATLVMSGTLKAQSEISPVLSDLVQSATSVRSMSMGHTTLGLSQEMHLYTNPAALLYTDRIEKTAVGISAELFPSSEEGRVQQYNIAASYKLDNSAFFFGSRYQGGLTISGTGDKTSSESFSPNHYTIDLGYAFKVTPDIVVYGQGSYFKTKVASMAQGALFGIGVGYNRTIETGATTGLLTLGARLQDAGAGVKFDGKGVRTPLPTSFSIGGDYRQELQEGHYLTIAATGRYFTPRDANLLLIGTGLEYSYRDMVAIRTGYRYGQGELAQWTVGLGGNYASFQLNVAYMMSLRPETSQNIFALSVGYQF